MSCGAGSGAGCVCMILQFRIDFKDRRVSDFEYMINAIGNARKVDKELLHSLGVIDIARRSQRF